MPNSTVVAVFDDRHIAENAIEDMVQAGIPRDRVNIRGHDGSGGATADTGRGGGLVAALRDLSVPEDDAKDYAESVRRGGTLLMARLPEGETERAIVILERYGPMDVKERGAAWREAGWTGYDETAAPYTETEVAEERARYAGAGQEEVIPVVEEQLEVGKRAAGDRRVRVHSHTVEEPVEEQVTLRDETVDVERRPVDRAAEGASGDDFEEKSVEMTETHEEPVVAKTARVKEEVVVRKGGQDRTETVRDNVRHTEVEVDRDGEAEEARRRAESRDRR